MMAIAAVALVGAGLAGAATHTYVAAACAALLDGAGAPIAAPQDITVNVSAPATAESGDTVTITFPGVTNSLPAVNIVPILSYQDLKTTFKITGSTFVAGTATHSGNAKIDGVNTAQTESITDPHTLVVTNAGPMPPGDLVPAQVSVHTVAGAIGSTIEITGDEVQTTANLGGFLTGHFAAATCPLPGDILSSTAVLAPPPPGAPDVQPDTGNASHGAAVTIDVLGNDDGGTDQPDPDSLEITTDPDHGTATVTAAHKILYTPEPGYAGIDAFQYQVCAVSSGPCAITVVNVTVTAAPTTTTTTTTTTVAPTTTTTVFNGLAQTGSSSSVPLSALGVLMSIVGGIAVALFRAGRDYRLPQ
jgi:hypothetical protein